MELVWPERDHLDGFRAALARGWSPDTTRPGAAATLLARVDADPDAMLAALVDRAGTGPPVELPDGSLAPRLPGYHRWLWDGEFCGTINVRWQPGTPDLPPHVLGHIGYSVVEWKRGRGYATEETVAVALPLVTIQGTFVFEDGRVLTERETLRFRERDEVAASLNTAGFIVDDVRDAPDRPGRELVFIASIDH